MANLSVKYMGLNLSSPIIAASCGLTNSVENIVELEKNGAGAVVLKSLFEEQIVNESNVILSGVDAYSLYGSLDYIKNYSSHHAMETYLNLIKEAKQKVSIPIIASINCSSSTEWIKYANQFEKAGADALELNIFILPSDATKLASYYEDLYLEIITNVKKVTSIPVSVKIGSFFTNMSHFIQKMSWAGANSIVLFNRFYTPDIDINNMQIKPASIYSTREEASNTLRWIAILSNIVECDLAATTGIHEGTDVVKQILAGATTVEIATTLYKNGFGKIKSMLTEIENWMNKNNFSSIADFKGKMSMKQADHPEVFSRVQFMKYFAGME